MPPLAPAAAAEAEGAAARAACGARGPPKAEAGAEADEAERPSAFLLEGSESPPSSALATVALSLE